MSIVLQLCRFLRVTLIICAEALKQQIKALAYCHFYHRFMGWIESGQTLNKIDLPNLVTYLNQTPIFEWCVARIGSKNGYPKDMSLEEIRLHAENMMTILGSTINIIGGTYMTIVMSTRIFSLIMDKQFM